MTGKSVDWTAIEAEYRAGMEPVRAIARRHGVGESSIRARAKASGWTGERGATPRQTRKAAEADARKGHPAQACADGCADAQGEPVDAKPAEVLAAGDHPFPADELTPEQAEFVARYLSGESARKIAQDMGLPRGYGPQMLSRNKAVARAVAAGKIAMMEMVGVTPPRIVREDARIAFADMRGIFQADGSLIPPHELPDDVAAALASVEIVDGYDSEGRPTRRWKYRLWDKSKSLDRLGRAVGIYKSDREAAGGPAVAVQINNQGQAPVQPGALSALSVEELRALREMLLAGGGE